MVTCAVASCKNSSAKSTKCKNGITFHRFPQDEKRRKRWEIAVKREVEWVSTESSVVCSEHFEVNEIYYTKSGLRRLLIDAIPTMNVSLGEDPEFTVPIEHSVEIKPADTEEVKKLKHKIRRLELISANRKRQIKSLVYEKKRMKSKLKAMDTILEHLVENQKEMGNT